MTFSDAIIIYLAIGSPIAVYHFLRSGKDPSFSTLALAIPLLFLWPIYTIWLIRLPNTSGRFRKVYSPDYAGLDARTSKRVDAIRVGMEEILNTRLPGRSPFDFREVFERYVGLSSMGPLNPVDARTPFAGLTSSARADEELNAICLNRRNERHLEFHQIRARNDFMMLVETISEQGFPDGKFFGLATELASLIADREMIEYLAVINEQSRPRSIVTDLENEVWTSKAHEQAIVTRM